jgi:hypothetical protein
MVEHGNCSIFAGQVHDETEYYRSYEPNRVPSKEEHEVSPVSNANTVAYPEAVVVEPSDAVITVPAM